MHPFFRQQGPSTRWYLLLIFLIHTHTSSSLAFASPIDQVKFYNFKVTLLDLNFVFTADLKEKSMNRLCEIPPLFKGYLPLLWEVDLIANYCHNYIFWTKLLNIIEVVSDLLERLGIGNIIKNNKNMRSPVVRCANSLESVLTRSLPTMLFIVSILPICYHRFKIYAYCWHISILIKLIDQLCIENRFACGLCTY